MNMNQYILLTLLAIGALPLQAQDATLLIGDIEANGWTLVAETKGDLDGDAQDERVLVYDTGAEVMDGTARQLYVFQWTSVENEAGEMTEDWQVWLESATAVLPGKEKADDSEADILSGLAVADGRLTIDHQGVTESTSWTYQHQYKLMDDNLKLVELETVAETNCEKKLTFHHNLISGMADCTREEPSCAEGNNGSARMDFIKKAQTLPAISDYQPGAEKMTVMGLNEEVRF